MDQYLCSSSSSIGSSSYLFFGWGFDKSTPANSDVLNLAIGFFCYVFNPLKAPSFITRDPTLSSCSFFLLDPNAVLNGFFDYEIIIIINYNSWIVMHYFIIRHRSLYSSKISCLTNLLIIILHPLEKCFFGCLTFSFIILYWKERVLKNIFCFRPLFRIFFKHFTN
jgi:hypothetical protein